MAANAANVVEDLPAETLDGFDVDGGAPWYASKRAWIGVLIAVVLAVEAVVLARQRDPLAAQRQEVAAYDDKQKAELAEQWSRFEKFTPQERQRIRELHAAIEADANPDALRAQLQAYQLWKAGLSPQQSAALVGLSPQKRIEEVRKFAGEQTVAGAKILSNEDAKTIVVWLEKQVDAVQDKLIEATPPEFRERFEQANRRERNWMLMMSIASFRGSMSTRLEALSIQAVAELRDQLSPAARKTFDAAPSTEARKQLLTDWIRQAVYRNMGYRDGGYASRVDDKELQRFFDADLTESERGRYLALPREEMASQLRREYLRRKGLWKDPSYGSGFGGRGSFSRGPGTPGGPGGMIGPGGSGERRATFGPGAPNNPPRDGRPPEGRSPDDIRPPGRPGQPPEPRDDFRPNGPRPTNPGPTNPRPVLTPAPPKPAA